MGERESDGLVIAAQGGDEAAFATLTERYRRELRVHCYRMLGSLDESEDLVQETFLRAWKNLWGFEGRSTFRAWLYRIATNACLDCLDGQRRRLLPSHLAPPSDPTVSLPPRSDIAWLQPYPDRLWAPTAPYEGEPEATVVTRETIELAFLAAIQYLPPRQRAVLILCEALGWTAKQTAELLESSVASVNSALQRARATMKEQLPERRFDWVPQVEPTKQERAVLRRYIEAVEQADLAAVAELLAEDVRASMPPYPMWFRGRDNVMATLTTSWDSSSRHYIGRLRMIPITANRQPAVAGYAQSRDGLTYAAFAIGVLRIDGGRIAEITAFHDTNLFPAFDLSKTL